MAQVPVDRGYLNGTSNGGLKIYKYLLGIECIYVPQVRVEWEYLNDTKGWNEVISMAQVTVELGYLNGTSNGGLRVFKWHK